MEERARERVAARDWAGAVVAYQNLKALVDTDRAEETAVALQFCRTLARAAELEAKADWAGALEIYKRLQAEGAPARAYLGECIRRVEPHLDAGSPR
jgi:hypothetical protein